MFFLDRDLLNLQIQFPGPGFFGRATNLHPQLKAKDESEHKDYSGPEHF